MPADDAVGLIRHSDISRLTLDVHETLASVQTLTGVVTELRIDIAKNYATKVDLLQSMKELKQDTNADAAGLAGSLERDAAGLASNRERDAAELAEALKDHLASDDDRFARLEKMLWWVLGLLGTGMLGVIYTLVTVVLGHGK
jgi:hypothetical protein